ncbi:MAG: asparaginase [Acetobacteraceae bacterium]|nr:asparaginase [Acetobacteraceae bacterium]
MAEPLVEVRRGGLVESIHRGHVVVVDGAGRARFWVGDPGRVVLARSSAKPFQALACVHSGAADRFGIAPRELAVMCGSHWGEDAHVQAVRSILARLGLDEGALECGTHRPVHQPSADRLVREGLEPGAVHSNCSGKHAGMLAVAVQLQAPVCGYRQASHPAQRYILSLVSEITGEPAAAIRVAVDGCGAPVFALPLKALARGFARLARPAGLPAKLQEAASRVVAAMQANPEMVGGSGSFDTRLLSELKPRVVCKGGAEAVYCLGLTDRGWGLALKVEDGGGRAVGPIVLEVLRQIGALKPAEEQRLRELARPAVKNHRGEAVGELAPVFTLAAAEGVAF